AAAGGARRASRARAAGSTGRRRATRSLARRRFAASLPPPGGIDILRTAGRAARRVWRKMRRAGRIAALQSDTTVDR
ncbi:hypothetical protein, partial [Burkholderia glumae]